MEMDAAMNTTTDGGNQPRRELRGDPVAPRRQDNDTRDYVVIWSGTSRLSLTDGSGFQIPRSYLTEQADAYGATTAKPTHHCNSNNTRQFNARAKRELAEQAGA